MSEQDKDALRKAVKRMQAARDFPANTDPASRHVALMVETIAKGKPYSMFADDPEHCAMSLAYVVADLWETRAEREKDRAVMRQALEALAGYRREIGAITGQSMLQPCDAEDALRSSLTERVD